MPVEMKTPPGKSKMRAYMVESIAASSPRNAVATALGRQPFTPRSIR